MADGEQIPRAVRILREGGLVGLPTETVYGLAADAENELAVRRIFAVKGRPQSHPLIVHLPGIEHAEGFVREVPEAAKRLAEALWPGPLTIVLRRGPRALDVVTGGQDTVAIRVPAHPLAHALLEAFGGGLAAPSANRFGKVSPTCAAHVRADLGGEVDLVLDGGASEVGVESTIVDLSQGAPALLRPGGVPVEEIERVLGQSVPARIGHEVRAPGMLDSHYAPRAGVVIVPRDAVDLRAAELQGQGQRVAAMVPAGVELAQGIGRIEVPEAADELARVLYAKLREVDARGFEVVVVCSPPAEGLGRAVRDRLKRAAHRSA